MVKMPFGIKKLFGRIARHDAEARGAAKPAPLDGNPLEYGKLPDDRLIELLFTEADQLPAAAAQEVVARGRRLIPALSAIIEDSCNWHREDAGWCATVHAGYLLGTIADEAAIPAILLAMDEADHWEDELLGYQVAAAEVAE